MPIGRSPLLSKFGHCCIGKYHGPSCLTRSLCNRETEDTERYASPAAGSRSDAGAKAGGGQVQALVRPGSRVIGAELRCAPRTYWITSSARSSRDGGIVMP